MAITKATASSVAPAAKGDLVVGSATNDAAVLGVGTNNQILVADSSTATGLKWATPASGALSFTQRFSVTDPTYSYPTTRGIIYANSLYVAWFDYGFIFTSSDAITWTERTSGFTRADTILRVKYLNNLWVAVGQNGTITTSTDAVTWTTRTSNMGTNQINDVAYGNGYYVAVGAGGGTTNTGGITYSTDGITWTRKSQSITVGTGYNCVVWNGTNFLVGAGVSGGNNYLYASDPSSTWTAAASTTSAINNIIWDGTRHYFNSGSSHRVSNSTSILSSPQTLQGMGNPTGNKQEICLYNGRIYVMQYAVICSFAIDSSGFANSYKFEGYGGFINPDFSSNFGSQSNNCFFIGSTGMLIGSDNGRIATSF